MHANRFLMQIPANYSITTTNEPNNNDRPNQIHEIQRYCKRHNDPGKQAHQLLGIYFDELLSYTL
jgi:hypothetical protein